MSNQTPPPAPAQGVTDEQIKEVLDRLPEEYNRDSRWGVVFKIAERCFLTATNDPGIDVSTSASEEPYCSINFDEPAEWPIGELWESLEAGTQARDIILALQSELAEARRAEVPADKIAGFGRAVYDWMRTGEIFEHEYSEDFCEIAKAHGLANQVPYDPAIHTLADCCSGAVDEGDMIWWVEPVAEERAVASAVPVYAIADRKPPIAPDSIRSHEVIALTINSSGEIGECCEAVWNYAFGYWECPDDETGWTHWMEKPVVSVVPTPEGGENDGE